MLANTFLFRLPQLGTVHVRDLEHWNKFGTRHVYSSITVNNPGDISKTKMDMCNHAIFKKYYHPKMSKSKKKRPDREPVVNQYVSGAFQFGRGQRPPKNSLWAKRFAKIDACPLKSSKGGTDVFGRQLECHCGYHKPQVKVK